MCVVSFEWTVISEADSPLSVLCAGHCYDSQTGQPPRGLQFILGTNSTPAIVDTIVMANLVSDFLFGAKQTCRQKSTVSV